MQRIDNNGPESSFNIPLVPYSTNTGSVVINSEAVLKSESVRFQFLQVDFKLLFFFQKYDLVSSGKIHKNFPMLCILNVHKF